MNTSRYNLMKILSSKDVLIQDKGNWYCHSVQKARYDKLDVVIETVEKL